MYVYVIGRDILNGVILLHIKNYITFGINAFYPCSFYYYYQCLIALLLSVK